MYLQEGVPYTIKFKNIYKLLSQYILLQTRAALDAYIVRSALGTSAEPLPGYGTAAMMDLRVYYGELVQQEATLQSEFKPRE